MFVPVNWHGFKGDEDVIDTDMVLINLQKAFNIADDKMIYIRLLDRNTK